MDEQTENTLRQIIGEQDSVIAQQRDLIAALTDANVELRKVDAMQSSLIAKYEESEKILRDMLRIAGINV